MNCELGAIKISRNGNKTLLNFYIFSFLVSTYQDNALKMNDAMRNFPCS